LRTLRLPLMTCAHSETHGRPWRRPAYDRRHPGRAGGHGVDQPDDKVKGPERRNGDTMQLELSNFQPLAANEAIEEEVPDLGGAEQLSKPMIEESDQGLASLIRSLGMTSITDIDNLAGRTSEGVTLNAAYRRPIGANVGQAHLSAARKTFHICPPPPVADALMRPTVRPCEVAAYRCGSLLGRASEPLRPPNGPQGCLPGARRKLQERLCRHAR
jgi:hypothetical protein